MSVDVNALNPAILDHLLADTLTIHSFAYLFRAFVSYFLHQASIPRTLYLLV